MRHKKSPAAAPVPTDAAPAPGNLLDLNRSLPNYAYQPNRPQPDPTDMTHHRTDPSLTEQAAPKRWKRILLWSLAAVLLVGVFSAGWVGFKLLSNEVKLFGWGGIFSLLHHDKLKGEDSGHVNILLAGNSADDPNHAGSKLTDSIMVVSINTTNHTAFMLSVPRDLYVNIPGEGYGKINEAYQDGQQDHFSEVGYADGGMGLLEKTVSQSFGLPIHYYALVNYSAVRQAVDALGGVTVTIKSDDPRGLYDPSPDLNNHYQPLVKLSNGAHTLNGVQALGLARARGDHYGSYGYALSDFARTTNQRLLLLAMKDKALSAGTLANPVKLGQLFDAVGNNVNTDLTLGNVRRLYDLSKLIPDSAVTSVGLNDVNGNNLLSNYQTNSGQSALIPRLGLDNFDDIQAYIQQLLQPPAATNGSGASGNSSQKAQ